MIRHFRSTVAAAIGRGFLVVFIVRVLTSPAHSADDPVVVCTQRLKAIHQALVACEREHQEWPGHLSDLVPKYLPDAAVLRDPADAGLGDLGSSEAHGDPRFHTSYSYERTSDVSNGLAQPLFQFPKPDIPKTGWGSWRLVNGRMEAFFGDQVPLVRCYHHRPPEDEREPGKDCVLNLTPSGRVYQSDFDWRRHPDSLEFLLRTLERDLTQGPAYVVRTWLIWRVDEFFSGDLPLTRRQHGPRLSALGEALLREHRQFTGEERRSCRLAARFFRAIDEPDRALQALDTAAAWPTGENQPITEDELRATIYHAAKRWDDEIATYRALLAQRPEVKPYMEKLADALEAAGKLDQARLWRDKADPGRLLANKPAPPFKVTLADGGTLTLESALRGKKAVLLDFWFCACGPCRLSFPHLEQLYASHQSQGLTVVAVNFGDSKDAIEQFAKEQKISFALGVGREGEKDNPIFQNYHVTNFPTSFLIDSRGTIVWRAVGFGPDFKQGLSAALGKLGIE